MPTQEISLSRSLTLSICLTLLLNCLAIPTVFAAGVTPFHIQQTAVNLCPAGTKQFRLEEQELTNGIKTDGDIEIELNVYPAPDGDDLSAFDFTVLSGHTILVVGTMDGLDGGYYYDYRASGGTQGDTFLTSPGPPDGTYKDISHIDFCYDLGISPTAAPLDIGGRIVRPNGGGVPGAILRLEDLSTGEVFTARTDRLGFYTFYDVGAGDFYRLSITNQRNRFVNPSISFILDTDSFDMNFVSSN